MITVTIIIIIYYYYYYYYHYPLIKCAKERVQARSGHELLTRSAGGVLPIAKLPMPLLAIFSQLVTHTPAYSEEYGIIVTIIAY